MNHDRKIIKAAEQYFCTYAIEGSWEAAEITREAMLDGSLQLQSMLKADASANPEAWKKLEKHAKAAEAAVFAAAERAQYAEAFAQEALRAAQEAQALVEAYVKAKFELDLPAAA